MIPWIRLFLGITLGLNLILPVSTYGSESIEIFAGAGTNYAFPASVRFGYGSWEAGLLSPTTIGVVKGVKSNGAYFNFGPAVNFLGGAGYGFMGAVGFRYAVFKPAYIRGELYTNAAHDGVVESGALLGVSLLW